MMTGLVICRYDSVSSSSSTFLFPVVIVVCSLLSYRLTRQSRKRNLSIFFNLPSKLNVSVLSIKMFVKRVTLVFVYSSKGVVGIA